MPMAAFPRFSFQNYREVVNQEFQLSPKGHRTNSEPQGSLRAG